MSRAWHVRGSQWRARVVALVPVASAVLAAAPAARAEPLFYSLPGGIRVKTAETLPAGEATVELMSGGGYRAGLLDDDHRFLRVAGIVSAAFGVTDTLSLGAAMDGYYDRHRGFAAGGCGESCEDGYVGAPHLFARVAKSIGMVDVGAQGEVWVPGDVAPSFKLAATSVDLRGLVARTIGPARLTLDAGFRLDNTANGIDDVQALTLADRISYGVSNYHALVGGVRVALPVSARMDVGIETSLAAFIGGAPDGAADLESGTWVGRLGISTGVRLAPRWTAVAFLEAVKAPRVLASQVMADNIPLVPYEPAFAAGMGIATRFGGNKPAAPRALECWETAAGCKTDEQALFAEIRGSILDQDGQPLVGATVTITGTTPADAVTRTTNADGTYTASVRIGRRLTTPARGGLKVVEKLEQAAFDIRAELDGREVSRVRVDARKAGSVEVPPITLEPALPVGQVKGIVRTQRGEPIADAIVSVEPGEHRGVTSADGSFMIDLAPGTYKVTVRAQGFEDQELAVTIEANGVALKEFVLRR